MPDPVYGNEIIGINGSSFFMAGEYFFSTGKVLAVHISLIPRVNSRCVCLGCVFVYFFMPRVNYRDVWLGCVFAYFFVPPDNSRYVWLGCV